MPMTPRSICEDSLPQAPRLAQRPNFQLIGLALTSTAWSLLATALLATIAACVGFWFESDLMFEEDQAAILDCCIQADQNRAILLQRTLTPNHGGAQIQIVVRDLNSRQAVVRTVWPELEHACLAPSADNNRFFVGSGKGGIYSISLVTPNEPPLLLGLKTNAAIDAIKCSADGRTLLSVGPNGLSALCPNSGTLKWQRNEIPGLCLVLHPQMAHVLCGTLDGHVVELEIESGRIVRSIRLGFGP